MKLEAELKRIENELGVSSRDGVEVDANGEIFELSLDELSYVAGAAKGAKKADMFY